VTRPATEAKKLKPLDARIAIRKWLATHGPWHSEPPAGVAQAVLDAELTRLARVSVLDVFRWEAEGLHYELKPLAEGRLTTKRVYVAGTSYESYIEGWAHT